MHQGKVDGLGSDCLAQSCGSGFIGLLLKPSGGTLFIIAPTGTGCHKGLPLSLSLSVTLNSR